MKAKEIEQALTKGQITKEQAITYLKNAISETESKFNSIEGSILYTPIDIINFYREFYDSESDYQGKIDKFVWDKYTWIKKSLKKAHLTLDDIFQLYWLSGRLFTNQKTESNLLTESGQDDSTGMIQHEKKDIISAIDIKREWLKDHWSTEKALKEIDCILLEPDESIPVEEKSKLVSLKKELKISFISRFIDLKQKLYRRNITNLEALGEIHAFEVEISALLEERFGEDAGEVGSLVLEYKDDEPSEYREQLKTLQNLTVNQIAWIGANPNHVTNMVFLGRQIEKQIQERKEYWEATDSPIVSANDDLNETSVAQPTPSEPQPLRKTGKIIWNWGKADLAWLYSTLVEQRVIDCNPSTFAAAFLTKDMEPMPSALLDYLKSRSPGKQGMKDIRAGLLHHEPEDIRK